MNDDNNVIRIVQYKQPPLWMEYGVYAGALGLFTATIANPGISWWPMALTAMMMYWNYKLFSVIREYVKHVNASQFNTLLEIMSQAELNKPEDGTFQDSSGLTKEQESEQESTEGDR